MSLNSEIIKKEYEHLQEKHRLEFVSNKFKIYEEYPELENIDKELKELKTKKAIYKINQNELESKQIERLIDEKLKEKDDYIKNNKIELNKFGIKYICNDCKDTGFINDKKCHCYIEKEINLLRNESNLPNSFYDYTFDNLDINCFNQQIKVTDELSYQGYMKIAMSDIAEKVNDIAIGKSAFLLFYGPTGSGKTYLSACIANNSIDKLKSVKYMSASDYINSFFKKQSDNSNVYDDYDVFILDDLGKETLSEFSIGKIFDLVNNRINKNLSLIISTDCSLNELSDIYGESIVSRIFNKFYIVKLNGEDLRRIKR